MIAVTGGAGFIGSHLVAQLVADGYPIRVIEKPGATVDHLPASVDIAFVDIRERDAVHRALRGVAQIYHLAANPNLWTRRRGHFRQVNFLGAVNVLDGALAAGAGRIVHCSTESILTRVQQTSAITEGQQVTVKDVIGPYCRSKFFAERYAMTLAATGAPVVVVNPTLPVGPGDRGVSPPTRMMLDFCRGGRSAYLEADLNLIDVRDVAAGMVRAMAVGIPGRRYLLGAEDWSVKRVFDFLAELAGRPKPTWCVPYPLALTAAYLSELLADVVTGVSPAATVTGVKLTRRRMQFDASRTWAALGITPRPVTESIREAVAWFQVQGYCRLLRHRAGREFTPQY